MAANIGHPQWMAYMLCCKIASQVCVCCLYECASRTQRRWSFSVHCSELIIYGLMWCTRRASSCPVFPCCVCICIDVYMYVTNMFIHYPWICGLLLYVCMHACLYKHVHVVMYLCGYSCICVWIHPCIRTQICTPNWEPTFSEIFFILRIRTNNAHACVSICMCASMALWKSICIEYLLACVFVRVFMFVFVFVCVCVFVFVFVCARACVLHTP